MPCDEWHGLLDRYRSAVSAYHEAVSALGVPSGAVFSERWQGAERARTRCTRYRADLLHHEHVHACLDVEHANGNKPASRERLLSRHHGQSGG